MISIVVPAYNEATIIQETVKEIVSFFQERSLPYELIVVDDGSTDATATRLSESVSLYNHCMVKQHPYRKGKGAAVRTGVIDSSGNYVFFMDADLSTPLEEFEKCLAALSEGGADVVIGSRALPDSDIVVPQPFYRHVMGKIFNILVRHCTGLPFRDTQCGFKGFKGDLIRALCREQETDGFAFDVELLLKALRRGAVIDEVPVRWRNRKASRVTLVRGPLTMAVELLRIKMRIDRQQV